MAYTLQKLLADVAKRWAQAGREKDFDFGEVWAVLDRYAADCLERRKGLVIPNLCKLGWQAHEVRGKSACRPYFRLCDGFYRLATVDRSKEAPPAPEKDLLAFEEFNFSKAAIRFSQGFTKDNVFSGLRLIVKQIADAVGQGRHVTLELSFGKFVAKDKAVHFAFSPELFVENGLTAPKDEAEGRSEVSAPSFVASTVAASGLALSGRKSTITQASTQPPPEQPAFDDQWESAHVAGSDVLRPAPSTVSDVVTPRRGPTSSIVSSAARATGARKELQQGAYEDALHREITNLELRASEALRDKAVVGNYHRRTLEEAEQQRLARRASARENGEYLRRQIEANERKRAASGPRPPSLRLGREPKDDSDLGVEEGLTGFVIGEELKSGCTSARGPVLPPSGIHAKPGSLSARGCGPAPGQLKLPRAFLDEQVEAKKRREDALKQRERQVELSLLARHEQSAVVRKQQEEILKAHDQASLKGAWDEEIRLRDIRKSIEAIEGGGTFAYPAKAMLTPLGAAASLSLQPTDMAIDA